MRWEGKGKERRRRRTRRRLSGLHLRDGALLLLLGAALALNEANGALNVARGVGDGLDVELEVVVAHVEELRNLDRVALLGGLHDGLVFG